MPDMLALDADYRERFGGSELLPMTIRIVLPAVLCVAMFALSGLWLLLTLR